MKETVVNYLKSSLQGWDCPSDNTFYRQLTCGEALLTWTLTVEEVISLEIPADLNAEGINE